MANAKKLTEPQITALRAAAREMAARSQRADTLQALLLRGLLQIRDGGFGMVLRITPAGRQALFEATGENGP
jgi:hypothetical protein